MYYLIVQLMMPFTLGCWLTWLAFVILWRRARTVTRRGWILAVPLAGLTLASLPAVAFLAIGSLEWRFPPEIARPDGCQAIVVLGGHIRRPSESGQQPTLADDSLIRCLHALDLYRQGPPCAIIVCGGNVDRTAPDTTLAEVMRVFLVSHGAAAADVVVEDVSRNTSQNVAEAIRLLRQDDLDQVVVVTDSTHLFRTKLCFEVHGFPVHMSGCRYRATRFVWGVLAFVPSPHAAADVQDAAHEWMGLVWYRLRGWI